MTGEGDDLMRKMVRLMGLVGEAWADDRVPWVTIDCALRDIRSGINRLVDRDKTFELEDIVDDLAMWIWDLERKLAGEDE
jgi:hypothetical protein